jgi:hypothetical protein
MEKKVYLTTQGICIMPKFERKVCADKLRENLELANQKGQASNGQVKSIWLKRSIGFCEMVRMQAETQRINKKRMEYYPVFLTLTLPATQEDTDVKIKRDLLNKFLIYGKRKSQFENYIWKAEKQKNGNIHFHLITDKFFNKDALQSQWNGILKSTNYMARFSEKFGHENPPSTHVTKIGTSVRLAEYLSKYVSKSENIGGRLMGCSDNLKTINYPTLDDLMTHPGLDVRNKKICKLHVMNALEQKRNVKKEFKTDWMTNFDLKKNTYQWLLDVAEPVGYIYRQWYNGMFNEVYKGENTFCPAYDWNWIIDGKKEKIWFS